MEVSVLIPTRGRPERLATCVAALARQSLPADRYEVVAGLDGPDGAAQRAAAQAWRRAGGRQGGLRIETCPRRGYIDVRHQLLPELRGDVYVSLNDDVEPSPDFLEAHARAHRAERAIIVGDSRFVAWEDPTLLDRLLDETGLVFFYHAMDAAEPRRDWGFRHCFGLNFSAPRRLVIEAGGVPSMPHTYGYDDLELAHRLVERFGLPVLYRPEARAPHRHRYRAADLLRRERALGVAACRYARARPAFAGTVFAGDILDPEAVADCRRSVEDDRDRMAGLEPSFLALDRAPAGDGPDDVDHAYARHLPLKRHHWRAGFVEELARTTEAVPS